MSSKKTARTAKSGKRTISIELHGKIELVERHAGRVVSRETIDGEVVLGLIMAALDRYLAEGR